MSYASGEKVIYLRARKTLVNGEWYDRIPCTYMYQTVKRHAVRLDSGQAVYVSWASIKRAAEQDNGS